MKTFYVRILGSALARPTKIQAAKLDDSTVGQTRFVDEDGSPVAIVVHVPGMVISQDDDDGKQQWMHEHITDGGRTASFHTDVVSKNQSVHVPSFYPGTKIVG